MYFLLKDTGCVGELSGHKHRIRGKFPYFISGEHKRDRVISYHTFYSLFHTEHYMNGVPTTIQLN